MSEIVPIEDQNYLMTGPEEKHIRNLHLTIGFIILMIETLSFPVQEWIISPGLMIPIFIVITGLFYNMTTSTETARLLLENVIKPRLGGVTEKEEQDYYALKRDVKISILVQGYIYAVLLTFFWMLLTSLGADPVYNMIFLPFCYFSLLLATGNIGAFLLKHTKYKNVISLLKVEVDWIYERREANRRKRRSQSDSY